MELLVAAHARRLSISTTIRKAPRRKTHRGSSNRFQAGPDLRRKAPANRSRGTALSRTGAAQAA
jgi:hypothetical protein